MVLYSTYTLQEDDDKQSDIKDIQAQVKDVQSDIKDLQSNMRVIKEMLKTHLGSKEEKRGT